MTNITSPPVIDALPPAPLPTDTPADFNAKGFATVAAQANMVPQINAATANVFSNATAAQERATAAGASAAEAVTQATNASTARAGAEAARDNTYADATIALGAKTAAAASASAASGSASAASTARAGAEAARDQALTIGAQLLTASSTTSLAIGTGAKSLTIETGRAFAPGMRLVLASAADPVASQMQGQVTSYDRSTGALAMSITTAAGSGSRSDWVIAVAGGDAGSLPVVVVTASTTVQPNRCYVVAAAGITLTLSGTWVAGDRFSVREAIGSTTYVIDFGALKVRSVAVGSITVPAAFAGADFTYLDATRGLI